MSWNSWVLLWSDAFILSFIVVVILMCLSLRQNTLIRAAVKEVFTDRLTVVAAITFLLYVVVGLADSLHFNLTVEEVPSQHSILDIFIKPRLANDERTFSAPFATHSYSMETLVTEEGNIERQFARLEFGGAHLTNIEDKLSDIKNKVGSGILNGLIIGVGIFIIGFFIRKKLPYLPWGTICGCLLFYATLFSVGLALSGDYHIFGTSKVGEDVFYQSLKSIRTGLMIGVLTTSIMMPVATILGLSAGYFKGRVDDAIQYLYTTLSAIPGVLLIAAMVLLLEVYMSRHMSLFDTSLSRADIRLVMLCAILGLTSWTGLCRLLRAEALRISQMEYVQAAKTLGTSSFMILVKHFLPNVMPIILISMTLDFSGFVLAEAVLSYIGVGVDPSTYSWGSMINGARLELGREPVVWWNLIASFAFMFVLVLSANLFADSVRDAFDPRKIS